MRASYDVHNGPIWPTCLEFNWHGLNAQMHSSSFLVSSFIMKGSLSLFKIHTQGLRCIVYCFLSLTRVLISPIVYSLKGAKKKLKAGCNFELHDVICGSSTGERSEGKRRNVSKALEIWLNLNSSYSEIVNLYKSFSQKSQLIQSFCFFYEKQNGLLLLLWAHPRSNAPTLIVKYN